MLKVHREMEIRTDTQQRISLFSWLFAFTSLRWRVKQKLFEIHGHYLNSFKRFLLVTALVESDR